MGEGVGYVLMGSGGVGKGGEDRGVEGYSVGVGGA